LGENWLQCLFDEPILAVTTLDPGYAEHGSDVWRVQTANQDVIVRRSRLTGEPDHEFWWGCKFLFGIDPRRMVHFAKNVQMLNAVADIPAPNVIFSAVLDEREYLVVDKMRGERPQQFIGHGPELLEQLGSWLANVHAYRLNYFGNVAGTQRASLQNFNPRLKQAMKMMVDREHPRSCKIRRHLGPILRQLASLPPPEYCCPILIDLGAGQFLVEDKKLSAIVDVEAYVVGPRELDFVGLEYVLNAKAAEPFVRGYTKILDLPDLTRSRSVYRYLYRLLGVQGSVDLDRWLARAPLF